MGESIIFSLEDPSGKSGHASRSDQIQGLLSLVMPAYITAEGRPSRVPRPSRFPDALHTVMLLCSRVDGGPSWIRTRDHPVMSRVL